MQNPKRDIVSIDALVMAFVMRYQRIPIKEICKKIRMDETRLRLIFALNHRPEAWKIFRLMSHDDIMNYKIPPKV